MIIGQEVRNNRKVQRAYLVMEFARGGNFGDFIAKNQKLNESTARFFFRQLIDGLEHCHKLNFSHRDLKPGTYTHLYILLKQFEFFHTENLLLCGSGPNYLDLKLADFGFAKTVTPQLHNTVVGTPSYTAPEVFSGEYMPMLADIWSCGVILFVMTTGCFPFDGIDLHELYTRLSDLEVKYPPCMSPKLRALLDKLFILEPSRRATLQDIRNDKWFCECDEFIVAAAAQPPNSLPQVMSSVSKFNDSATQLSLVTPPQRVVQIEQVKLEKEIEQVTVFELISCLSVSNPGERRVLIVSGFSAAVVEIIKQFFTSEKFNVTQLDNYKVCYGI